MLDGFIKCLLQGFAPPSATVPQQVTGAKGPWVPGAAQVKMGTLGWLPRCTQPGAGARVAQGTVPLSRLTQGSTDPVRAVGALQGTGQSSPGHSQGGTGRWGCQQRVPAQSPGRAAPVGIPVWMPAQGEPWLLPFLAVLKKKGQGRILGQQPGAEGSQQQSSFPGAGCCSETRERRDELETRGSARRNLKTQRRFCARCWSSFLSRCRFLFLARTKRTGTTAHSWGQSQPSPSLQVSAAWLGEQGSVPAAGASPGHRAAVTSPAAGGTRGAGAGTPCSEHSGAAALLGARGDPRSSQPSREGQQRGILATNITPEPCQ